jgi:hypothetical protein
VTRRRSIVSGIAASLLLAGAALVAGCGSSSTAVAPSNVEKCTIGVTSSTSTVEADGGKGRITIQTGRECTWSVASSASWITFASATEGRGEGSVDFTVARNGDPAPRSAVLRVGDQQVSITQRAGACAYQVSMTSANLPAAGGARDVDVGTSSAACTWSSTSRAEWIRIVRGASGTGNGRVTFEVAPATGPPRTGALVIADRTISVTQADGCKYSISPTTLTAPAAGGAATVNVTASGPCPWTATSGVPWIAVPGSAVAGSGTARLDISANVGPERTGAATVAGFDVAVQQASGCSFQVSPQYLEFGANGNTHTVTVTTAPGCRWTAITNEPLWLILGATGGTGPGTLTVRARSNTGPSRTGTVVVAGETITAVQMKFCSFGISPSTANFGSPGGVGSFRVTTDADCEWRARVVAGTDWVRITRGADGFGSRTVEFLVLPNPGGTRSTQIMVEDRPFKITQRGQ